MDLLFASLAMWTVYLMTILYLDWKNRKVSFTPTPSLQLSAKLLCITLEVQKPHHCN